MALARVMSKGEIDRLGGRLRGIRTVEDEELYANYRDSFLSVQLVVMYDLGRLGLGRADGGRLKRLESVIAKLQRDTRMRLSRMQDIAGCRLVTDTKAEQDEIYTRLQEDFDIYRAYDTRERPHSGYRAVHVVVRRDDKFIEVQVRTRNQREWALLSELATAHNPSIKYGGGDDAIRQALDDLSAVYWAYDQAGETPPPNLSGEVERLIARMR